MLGQITCNSTGKCIPQDWLCDQIVDCEDEEDEISCSCPLLHMECVAFNSSLNKCVDLFQVCDGVQHCIDNSDEFDCDCSTSSPRYAVPECY